MNTLHQSIPSHPYPFYLNQPFTYLYHLLFTHRSIHKSPHYPLLIFLHRLLLSSLSTFVLINPASSSFPFTSRYHPPFLPFDLHHYIYPSVSLFLDLSLKLPTLAFNKPSFYYSFNIITLLFPPFSPPFSYAHLHGFLIISLSQLSHPLHFSPYSESATIHTYHPYHCFLSPIYRPQFSLSNITGHHP